MGRLGRVTLLVTIGAVLLAQSLSPLLWAASQLMRSLWPAVVGPLPSALQSAVAAAEEAAWAHWETPQPPCPPLPVPEVALPGPGAPPLALDLTRPFVARGVLNDTNLLGLWTPEFFASPPQGNIMIDFFQDARRFNTVPDGFAPIWRIIHNITAGGPQKFGTEMVFRRYPNLFDEANLTWFPRLFGYELHSKDIGSTLTLPLFFAGGLEGATTRTDLHCEPIGNAMMMLKGQKKWTLLLPSQSSQLQPQVAPDGRAYIYATLPPDDPRLGTLQRYEVVVGEGDVLWVPTWTWHRVDYLPGVLALSVSLFHFRPWPFLLNNPLHALTLLPNLVK
eukprot:EG_transcript_18893